MLKETYMQHAIDLYHSEQQKDSPMSLQKVCQTIEQRCFAETKKKIKISDSTLHRRIHSGRSHTQAKEEQRWLNDTEVDILIHEVIYWAERGLPLDHKRLKEHADEIARARHGDAFPAEGVGKWPWITHEPEQSIPILTSTISSFLARLLKEKVVAM